MSERLLTPKRIEEIYSKEAKLNTAISAARKVAQAQDVLTAAAKDAECEERAEKLLDLARQQALYGIQERDRCQARMEEIKVLALRAIAEEPELPSDMPDEAWDLLNGNRTNTEETLRSAVRLTKHGIAGRFLLSLKAGYLEQKEGV